MRKKTLLTMAAAASMAILMTGCMKAEEKITVTSDGSGQIIQNVRMKKSALLPIFKESLETQDDKEAENVLELYGAKAVTVDGEEYYDFSEMLQKNGTGTVEFSDIPEFYKEFGSNMGSTLSAKEDNYVSISETSMEMALPKDADIINNIFAEKDTDEFSSLSSATTKMSPEDLKDMEVSYTVTFDKKIVEHSDDVKVSADGKTAQITFSAVRDNAIKSYAYCEGDIKVSGARNGMIYNKDVDVTLPDDVTAECDGVTANGGTLHLSDTKAYHIKLSDTKGDKESLCFIIDKNKPVIASNQKALSNKKKGKLTFYDAESGIDVSNLTFEGQPALYEIADIKESASSVSSMIGSYVEYELNYSNLSDGKHTILVYDKGGNYNQYTFTTDTTKPTVSGVKNGKTYKKNVTVKFKDINGIASAKLNGKKIKSGKKITKKGKYTLKVTDKASNVTTVKFSIKK